MPPIGGHAGADGHGRHLGSEGVDTQGFGCIVILSRGQEVETQPSALQPPHEIKGAHHHPESDEIEGLLLHELHQAGRIALEGDQDTERASHRAPPRSGHVEDLGKGQHDEGEERTFKPVAETQETDEETQENARPA